MAKENFEIKLRIKDKDGKIVDLQENFDLEVKWEEKKAKVPQEVFFKKKDGKEYRIIITKLEIFKGLFKKRRGSFSWDVPPNESYQIYHGEPDSGSGPEFSKGNDEQQDYYIKLTNPWRTEIITTFLIIVIIVIAVILFLWGWKKRKN